MKQKNDFSSNFESYSSFIESLIIVIPERIEFAMGGSPGDISEKPVT